MRASRAESRRFYRAAALAALACAALVVAPASAAGEPVPGSASYGLVAASPNGMPGSTHAERVAGYQRLRDAGVGAVRVDVNWGDVEPAGAPAKDFDFSRSHAEIAAASEAGLRVIGLLAYGHADYSARGREARRTPFAGGLPPFAIGNANYFPPDDPADFADYARAAAASFGEEVIAWEIWNEQNQGWRFWPPHEDPAAYAELLCSAHDAIRAVDSARPVVFGGVFFPAVPPGAPGMSGPDFVRASYAASERQLGTCFDVLAYHPYPYPFTAPELDAPVRGSVLSAYDDMRAALPAADAAKPLWITEVGWPTHDRAYGVSEAKQAQYLARTLAASFAGGPPVVTWYTYGDGADPSGLNQEAAFGLFRSDGSAKPAYHALSTLTALLDGTSFSTDLSAALGLPSGGPPRADVTGGRGFALEFRGPGRRVVALWYANESVGEGQSRAPDGGSVPPASLSVSVPVSSSSVRVVELTGEERVVAADGGVIELELGPSPRYVIESG